MGFEGKYTVATLTTAIADHEEELLEVRESRYTRWASSARRGVIGNLLPGIRVSIPIGYEPERRLAAIVNLLGQHIYCPDPREPGGPFTGGPDYWADVDRNAAFGQAFAREVLFLLLVVGWEGQS